MALKTKIRETFHYVERVIAYERLGNKDLRYANKTFDHIMKRVRRGQIRPFPGKKEGTFGVHFRWLVYIYSPNPDWSYTIITVYDKNQQQAQPS